MQKLPHVESVRNKKLQEDVAYVKEKTKEIETRIIDWFYLLAFHCHGVRNDFTKWRFDRKATSNFRDVRAACLKLFGVLCNPSAEAGEMLTALLGFIHLELVFMAQTFPSVVDSNLKADQWQS
jgi:hypothetical protein